MWFLVFLNWLAAFCIIFSEKGFSGNTFYLGLKLGVFLVTWIIFLAEASFTNRYNRSWWIIVLIITPIVTYPFYLLQHRKLIKMQSKKEVLG